MLIFLLACCVVTMAQSDFPADSIVTNIEAEQDTVYSTQSAGDSTTYRSTPDSTITRLQQMKAFEYANDPDYWKKKEVAKPRSNEASQLFWTLFEYLLFGVFIVALLYILFRILADSKIILWKRKSRQVASQQGDNEIEEKDLLSLIAEAEQLQQFRLAARYRYMQLLEDLNTRQLIRLHGELTNWDYIRQMGAHPLTSKFRYLTFAYEYVWYGEFDLRDDQYAQLRNKFETFFH